MTLEIAVVYAVILAALVLFASDKLRLDVVALLALLALLLTGILDVNEALAGFADPVVLMIAGLFVVGEGLFRTGIAARIARLPARLAGDSEVRLIVAVMVIVAVLSGFMSSTGTVAVMLPVVMGIAWERGIAPSRLLIPVAIAALLGGMLTLIGTAPNIVVANQLADVGREPFGFFTFTPVGLVMVVAGIAFMVLVGRRFLPDRVSPTVPDGADATSIADLALEYRLPEGLVRARIPPSSPLVGQTVGQAALRSGYVVTIVEVRREDEGGPFRKPRRGAPTGDDPLRAPWRDVPTSGGPLRTPRRGVPTLVVPETRFEAGDELLLYGVPNAVAKVIADLELDELEATGHFRWPEDAGLVEVILTPRSSLIGHTLTEVGFREKYRVTVLGIRRLGKPVHDDVLRTTPLQFGDTLLVKGPWSHIERLQSERRDFVVAGPPREMAEAQRPYSRAPASVAIMLGMLVLMSFGIVEPVTAVLMAAVGMVLTRCVGVEDAYRSIHWQSVVLIAAVLPMATALSKTGGLALVVEGLTSLLGGGGPMLMLATLFVLTSFLSQVISNTATAVLLAPIAVELAFRMQLAPEPFLMGIAVAASTAFMTPIASPVNVLVLGPGGYRFSDFFRVGALLQIVVLAATLAVVPWLFPFGG